MFTYDLDLLGSAILAIYSSVFLFLTLLSMVQTSYEAVAFFTPQAKLAQILILLFSFFCSLQPLVSNAPITFLNAQTYSSVLWTDVAGLCSEFIYSTAIGLHFMFYKVFIAETIAFNIYLLLGLVVAVLVLNSIRKEASFRKAQLLQAKKANLAQAAAPLQNVRTVYSFRRQTRRKNNSNIRHKL